MTQEKTDGLTKAEEAHLDESFKFGCDRAYQLMDDALERKLDTWAVASQMFFTASFVLAQAGVGLDVMIEDCKEAIKDSEEADKQAK